MDCMDVRAEKMKMNPIRFLNLPATAFVTFVLLLTGGPSYGFTLDKVLATVEKEAITLSDYLLFASSLGIEASMDKVDETLLKKLIEEKVILAEAKRRGVVVSDTEVDKMIEEVGKENSLSRGDLERELAKDGTNIQSFMKLAKDRLTTLRLIEMDVDSKVIVKEADIADFYDANRRDYLISPARVEVKAIFLPLNEGASVTEITDLKRKALKVAAQLKEGERFESLVGRYDGEGLKKKDGRLGEFRRGDLIPRLDEKAFSMTNGETSSPVWVKEGVYILKLLNRADDVYKPLGEVREEIGKRLHARQKERLFNEWMRTLWEKTSVVIN